MSDLVAQLSTLTDEERMQFFEESLGNITLGECLRLVKHLEKTFGVEAKPKMPEFTEQQVEEDEVEQTEFSAVLTDVGQQKIQVIRAVRAAIAGLSLKEAKDKLSPLPSTLLDGATKEAAEKLKETLTAAGATVEIK